MGVLICNLPLVIIVAPKNFILNRQLRVRNSKYAVVCDRVPTGHVTEWVFWPFKWAEHCNG